MRSETTRQGSALLVTVIVLAMMGMIGLSAMDAVTQDQQTAGYQKRSRQAFYAAEAGAATALELIANATNPINPPSIADTNLGTTSEYHENGQPSFRGDPSVTNPIRVERSGPAPGFGWGSGYVTYYWVANVEGQEPGGSSARIEVSKRVIGFQSGYR